MKLRMRAALVLILQLLVWAALSGACCASVLHLKNGGTIEGEVLKADEELVQIKSGDKLLEIEWKELADESIREFHPVVKAGEQKKLEEKRRLEEKRKREEEKRKLEEQKKLLEEQRREEEKKKLEEQKRLDELKKKEKEDEEKAGPVITVRRATVTGAFKPLSGRPVPLKGTSVCLVRNAAEARLQAERLRLEAAGEVTRIDAGYAGLVREYSRAAAERVSAVNAQQWDRVNEVSESCRKLLAEQERLSQARKDVCGSFPGAVREFYRQSCALECVTDGDGGFTFSDVAPGSYILFSAWEPGGMTVGAEQVIDVPDKEGSSLWNSHESSGNITVESVLSEGIGMVPGVVSHPGM